MTKQSPLSIHEAISSSLFQVAMTLEHEGKVHQALTPYLKIIEQYPGTSQAPSAVEKVMAIADRMRQNGQCHVAMRVYDRLEKASEQGSESD